MEIDRNGNERRPFESRLNPMELDEQSLDIREVYFLVLHFLSGGPCRETARVLAEEAAAIDLLPRRLALGTVPNASVSPQGLFQSMLSLTCQSREPGREGIVQIHRDSSSHAQGLFNRQREAYKQGQLLDGDTETTRGQIRHSQIPGTGIKLEQLEHNTKEEKMEAIAQQSGDLTVRVLETSTGAFNLSGDSTAPRSQCNHSSSPMSYEDLRARYSHIPHDYLLTLLRELLTQSRAHPPTVNAAFTTFTAATVTEPSVRPAGRSTAGTSTRPPAAPAVIDTVTTTAAHAGGGGSGNAVVMVPPAAVLHSSSMSMHPPPSREQGREQAGWQGGQHAAASSSQPMPEGREQTGRQPGASTGAPQPQQDVPFTEQVRVATVVTGDAAPRASDAPPPASAALPPPAAAPAAPSPAVASLPASSSSASARGTGGSSSSMVGVMAGGQGGHGAPSPSSQLAGAVAVHGGASVAHSDQPMSEPGVVCGGALPPADAAGAAAGASLQQSAGDGHALAGGERHSVQETSLLAGSQAGAAATAATAGARIANEGPSQIAGHALAAQAPAGGQLQGGSHGGALSADGGGAVVREAGGLVRGGQVHEEGVKKKSKERGKGGEKAVPGVGASESKRAAKEGSSSSAVARPEWQVRGRIPCAADTPTIFGTGTFSLLEGE